jgi:hypothetical protein
MLVKSLLQFFAATTMQVLSKPSLAGQLIMFAAYSTILGDNLILNIPFFLTAVNLSFTMFLASRNP